jgi:hypothetical protein
LEGQKFSMGKLRFRKVTEEQARKNIRELQNKPSIRKGDIF